MREGGGGRRKRRRLSKRRRSKYIKLLTEWRPEIYQTKKREKTQKVINKQFKNPDKPT